MFIEPLICRHLGAESEWKRLAFMAYCCEPMLGNFSLYHLDTKLGCPDILRYGLEAAWDAAHSGTFTKDADLLASLARRQSPGYFNEGRPYAHVAGQATWAISHLLRSLRGPSLLDALEVADAAIYSIERHYRNELLLSKRGRSNREHLLRAETTRLAQCLERLAISTESDRRKSVARLKRLGLRTTPSIVRGKSVVI